MNITGASGAIPRNDWERMGKHAELFYEEVRKRRDDVEKIAQNTGFPVKEIQNVKEHMFFNRYDLGRKEPSRFDPDYDQAVSWQRLTEGKEIREMDIVMLKHEIMEYDLMVGKGYGYRDAHDMAELEYNYAEHVRLLNEKEGLF